MAAIYSSGYDLSYPSGVDYLQRPYKNDRFTGNQPVAAGVYRGPPAVPMYARYNYGTYDGYGNHSQMAPSSSGILTDSLPMYEQRDTAPYSYTGIPEITNEGCYAPVHANPFQKLVTEAPLYSSNPALNMNYNMMLPPSIPGPAVNDQVPVTGGVADQLDYEIEKMSVFVATMSFGILSPGTTPSPDFQTSLTRIFTATRLPKATIVLSLVYLSTRWSLKTDTASSDQVNEDFIFRMVVVSLLLANKFNDDNTFVNKSWAQATGLPVQEITEIEKSWLSLVQWTLHSVESDGWSLWNDCWDKWLSNSNSVTYTPKSTSVQYQSDISPSRMSDVPSYYSNYSSPSSASSVSSYQYMANGWYDQGGYVDGPKQQSFVPFFSRGLNAQQSAVNLPYTSNNQFRSLALPPPYPDQSYSMLSVRDSERGVSSGSHDESNAHSYCSCKLCAFEPSTSRGWSNRKSAIAC